MSSVSKVSPPSSPTNSANMEKKEKAAASKKRDDVTKVAKNALSSAEQAKTQKAASSVPKITKVTDVRTYNRAELLKFYRGEIANIFGVTLADMQKFSFDDKESKHDYIQWMWPLKDPSTIQEAAKGPALQCKEKAEKDKWVLDAAFIKTLQGDATVVSNARKSFASMLNFYGLEFDGTNVKKAKNYAERSTNWLNPGDHNHYRLSRMLESLQIFGLKKEAAALFACLKEIASECPDEITVDTVKNWCSKTPDVKWNEVRTSLKEAHEERGIEPTLKRLAEATKRTWIRSDLTLSKSNWFTRLIWILVAKHFDCLRRAFFGIDLKQSQENLVAINIKMLRNPARYGKYEAMFKKAVANYEKIVSKEYHCTWKKQFGRISFQVKPGNIVTENADVIVNAANEALQGGGGVDYWIHRLGGPTILAACNLIRQNRITANRSPDSEPGESVITTAGNLPGRHVVHTVAPRWQTNPKKQKENKGKDKQLYDAYFSSLKLAHDHGAVKVTLPSLGTGIFGWPIERAAKIALTAIKDFAKQYGNRSSLRTVAMLAFGDDNEKGLRDWRAYRNAAQSA